MMSGDVRLGSSASDLPRPQSHRQTVHAIFFIFISTSSCDYLFKENLTQHAISIRTLRDFKYVCLLSIKITVGQSKDQSLKAYGRPICDTGSRPKHYTNEDICSECFLLPVMATNYFNIFPIAIPY
jgi:hypothetical protein